MRILSKSKLLAFRQCPKRLWMEVHRPELRADTASAVASFQTGHAVGDVARAIYDTAGDGVELKLSEVGMAALLAETTDLLGRRLPIFEAGFTHTDGAHRGVLALADVMLPLPDGTGWRMVEVKSSTELKSYHRDDAAIQVHVALSAGVDLRQVAVAHIDSSWTYPGGGDYRGLLEEVDLTEEALARRAEVQEWVVQAHEIVALDHAPAISPGDHCNSPYTCGFCSHCESEMGVGVAPAEFPVDWLPRVQSKALKTHIAQPDVRDLRDVPDDLLGELQRRVKRHTLDGNVYFDREGAAAALAPHALPANFLDFETISFAVPIWAGTRPYQQVPFQFSLHTLAADGSVSHVEFLDLSGGDPSRALASAMIVGCGEEGPIYVYNRGFEGARIREMAARFQDLEPALRGLDSRLVDLLPVTRNHYYHPSQCGSWSIKSVLPAIAPDLSYSQLDGVQDGGGAQLAFLEGIDVCTTPERRVALREQLLRYCHLDTWSTVLLWQLLSGRQTYLPAASGPATHRPPAPAQPGSPLATA